ncbi:MAG: hypothetical protein NTZ73_00045 [Candidatus Diapherotrites archaeon]|nr:hypothetical protein [Candidatus Diapherotrites archaeon]
MGGVIKRIGRALGLRGSRSRIGERPSDRRARARKRLATQKAWK